MGMCECMVERARRLPVWRWSPGGAGPSGRPSPDGQAARALDHALRRRSILGTGYRGALLGLCSRQDPGAAALLQSMQVAAGARLTASTAAGGCWLCRGRPPIRWPASSACCCGSVFYWCVAAGCCALPPAAAGWHARRYDGTSGTQQILATVPVLSTVQVQVLRSRSSYSVYNSI